jgi:hypothetical protein
MLTGWTGGTDPTSTRHTTSAGDRAWAPVVWGSAATAEMSWLGAATAEPSALEALPPDESPPKRATRTGTASTYGPGWKGWIAWPGGPGWRLRVCGPGGCVVVVTTDAGPDRAMQRAGRIVDLDVATFERVAGASWTTGLTKVKVTVLGKVAVARATDPES